MEAGSGRRAMEVRSPAARDGGGISGAAGRRGRGVAGVFAVGVVACGGEELYPGGDGIGMGRVEWDREFTHDKDVSDGFLRG
jgi:hypothetical protein